MTGGSGRATLVSLELGTAAWPLLLRWCTWEPPWGEDGHNDSYALLTPDGPVLVDPEAPPAALEELVTRLGGPPVAIMLTTDWHERGCYALRERLGGRVWAPAAGLPAHGGGLEGEPDHLYDDGAALPGGLRALRVRGTGQADHALAGVAPDGTHVLFTGDVLNGGADPRHPNHAHLPRRRPGLYAGASREYLQARDPGPLRRGARRLLRMVAGASAAGAAALICGGHGVPHHDRSWRALARLVELDWSALVRAGADVVVYPAHG